MDDIAPIIVPIMPPKNPRRVVSVITMRVTTSLEAPMAYRVAKSRRLSKVFIMEIVVMRIKLMRKRAVLKPMFHSSASLSIGWRKSVLSVSVNAFIPSTSDSILFAKASLGIPIFGLTIIMLMSMLYP